jgi:ankyrin repeat protein
MEFRMEFPGWVPAAIHYPPPTAVDTLCFAAASGDVPLVNRYLTAGVSASALDSYMHFPALKHAAVGGHLGVMDVLLRRGADIDQAGSRGLTALHFAALTFQLEALRFLLDRGACVSVADVDGDTPLMQALRMFLPCCVMDERKLAVVQRLLEAGAAVYGSRAGRLSALAEVVRAPGFSIPPPLQLRAFDLLIAYGADVENRDDDGRTALHHAALANNFEMAMRLLQLGADITAVDLQGQTAPDATARHTHNVDARVAQLLHSVYRRVTDKPRILAFSQSVSWLADDLVREIFSAREPETAYEHELEALAELNLRLHPCV